MSIDLQGLKATELPLTLAKFSNDRQTYALQRFEFGNMDDAQAAFVILSAEFHGEHAVAAVMFKPDPKPTVFIAWRSLDACVRSQMIEQLNPDFAVMVRLIGDELKRSNRENLSRELGAQAEDPKALCETN